MRMTPEGNILLEAIDTNCNTCKHFARDVEWANEQRARYNTKRLSHAKGYCGRKAMGVVVSNGICIPENGSCWETRRA